MQLNYNYELLNWQSFISIFQFFDKILLFVINFKCANITLYDYSLAIFFLYLIVRLVYFYFKEYLYEFL